MAFYEMPVKSSFDSYKMNIKCQDAICVEMLLSKAKFHFNQF